MPSSAPPPASQVRLYDTSLSFLSSTGLATAAVIGYRGRVGGGLPPFYFPHVSLFSFSHMLRAFLFSHSSAQDNVAHARARSWTHQYTAMGDEDVLMSPPSSDDVKTIGLDGGGGGGGGSSGAEAEEHEGAPLGAARVELAYEPRYQR